MIRRLKRWQGLAVGAALALLVASAWLVMKRWQTAPPQANPEQIATLTQRCQAAMLQDVCGVMKSSAPQTSQGRLFIAGIGEVDAQVFARLKAAGDTMCQEVADECTAEWNGQACRIGRALYPDVAQSPVAR